MRCLLLFCLLPVALLAQPSRSSFPWWETPLARDLSLSEDQSQKIRAITKEYRSRLIDQRAAVEKAEGEIEDLFNEDSPDQARGTAAIEKLAASRSELTRTFTQMSLRLRAVLTPAQWRELQRRRPQGPPAGMGPGFGGPGRPGMGPGGPGQGGPRPGGMRPPQQPEARELEE